MTRLKLLQASCDPCFTFSLHVLAGVGGGGPQEHPLPERCPSLPISVQIFAAQRQLYTFKGPSSLRVTWAVTDEVHHPFTQEGGWALKARASLIAQLVTNPPATQETRGLIPGWGRSPGEWNGYPLQYSWASLGAQLVKNPPAMGETWVWSLGWEDPPGEGNGYPIQYSDPQNSMDCRVHGVAKNRTRQIDSHFLKASSQNQGTSPPDTLVLPQWGPLWTSGPKDWKVIQWCRFTPLSLWSFVIADMGD